MADSEFGRRDLLVAGLAAGVAAGTFVTASDKGPGIGMAAAQEKKGGRLTLHAIDTYFGQTRAGLRIDLSVLSGDKYKLLKTVQTVERGRTKEPLIAEGKLKVGQYELLMHLDDYFAQQAAKLPEPPFLAKVPIRFGVYDADQRFHVPILFSPWSYSYYRGS